MAIEFVFGRDPSVKDIQPRDLTDALLRMSIRIATLELGIPEGVPIDAEVHEMGSKERSVVTRCEIWFDEVEAGVTIEAFLDKVREVFADNKLPRLPLGMIDKSKTADERRAGAEFKVPNAPSSGRLQ